MQRTDTLKKINALARESKSIQMSIGQLKKRLSERHNLPLPRKGRKDFELG